jgi:membrane protein implicated in regulation of membrane protease activity
MTFARQSAPELFSTPKVGVVDQIITLNQPGRIKYQASYWPARLYQVKGSIQLDSQQVVQVVGREGITLLVQPGSANC